MALTPQIDNQLNNEVQTIILPSKTYKLNITADNEPDRIIGFVDKIDAVKQAAYHILMTERYAYLIYSPNYGIELEQYIGQSFEYLEASIQETLREALTYDLRILDVEIIELTKLSKDIVNVKFNIISIYGNIQMEVNVNV